MVLSEIPDHFWMDCQDMWFTYSCPPQNTPIGGPQIYPVEPPLGQNFYLSSTFNVNDQIPAKPLAWLFPDLSNYFGTVSLLV